MNQKIDATEIGIRITIVLSSIFLGIVLGLCLANYSPEIFAPAAPVTAPAPAVAPAPVLVPASVVAEPVVAEVPVTIPVVAEPIVSEAPAAVQPVIAEVPAAVAQTITPVASQPLPVIVNSQPPIEAAIVLNKALKSENAELRTQLAESKAVAADSALKAVASAPAAWYAKHVAKSENCAAEFRREVQKRDSQIKLLKGLVERNRQRSAQSTIAMAALRKKFAAKSAVVQKAAQKAVQIAKPAKQARAVKVTSLPMQRPDPQLVKFLYQRTQIYSKTHRLQTKNWQVVRVRQGETLHDVIRRTGGDRTETFRFYVRNGIQVSQWKTVAVYCAD